MPNRILREGILTSERINTLTWEAEVFYRRLMSVVDDYGRYSAHPSLLRAALFPLKLDTVRDANMERLLALVEQASLVRVYEVSGKRYLEMLDFRQQVRAKDSKYPAPPSDAKQTKVTCIADAKHTQADAHLDVFGVVDVFEDVNPPTPRKREGMQFEEFWNAWPKSERKQDKAKCLDLWKRNSLDEVAGAILQDVKTKRKTQKWAEGYIEAPLVYLRGKRWEDGVTPMTSNSGNAVNTLDWRATQSGIRAKGIEVGIGDWDEAAFQTGRGEHFPAYRQRVEQMVSKAEEIDQAGLSRLSGLMSQKAVA